MHWFHTRLHIVGIKEVSVCVNFGYGAKGQLMPSTNSNATKDSIRIIKHYHSSRNTVPGGQAPWCNEPVLATFVWHVHKRQAYTSGLMLLWMTFRWPSSRLEDVLYLQIYPSDLVASVHKIIPSRAGATRMYMWRIDTAVCTFVPWHQQIEQKQKMIPVI